MKQSFRKLLIWGLIIFFGGYLRAFDFNVDYFLVLLKKNKINKTSVSLNNAIDFALKNNVNEETLFSLVKFGGFRKKGKHHYGKKNKSKKNSSQNDHKQKPSKQVNGELSLAWDIIKRAKNSGVAKYICFVDGKEHMFPCYVEKYNKNTYLIQLPCRGQKGPTCPLHTIVNSEIFATANHITIFIQRATSQQVTARVSGLVKKYLGGKAKTLHGGNMKKIIGCKSSCEIPVPGSPILRTILDHAANFNIWEDIFKQNILWDPRARFTITKKPEVLLYNIGGHWIALRIEQLPNKKNAILFAESCAYSKGKYLKKNYKKKLLCIAQAFGLA